MSASSVNEQILYPTVVSEHVQATISNGYCNSLKQEITSRLLPTASTTRNHKGKYLNIRRQLNAGTYDIQKSLDVATDRLIENLITEKLEKDEVKDTKQSL